MKAITKKKGDFMECETEIPGSEKFQHSTSKVHHFKNAVTSHKDEREPNDTADAADSEQHVISYPWSYVS